MKKSKKNLEDTPEVNSKSQRRRDALEVRSLATKLIGLNPAKLARLPLDEQVASAIGEARQFRSYGARKRQMQFVAKLLRRVDPEPLVEALDALENEARQLQARHHRSEAWRDRLLDAGDRAVGELLEHRRDADAQAIRQLIRNAQLETSRGKPPAAARNLFRILRDLDEKEPLPTPDKS